MQVWRGISVVGVVEAYFRVPRVHEINPQDDELKLEEDPLPVVQMNDSSSSSAATPLEFDESLSE